jgi:hypothetical protein
MSAAARHEQCWQLLPWLANGRLAGTERSLVEEHLRDCAACVHELSVQRLLCQTLGAPERVTYAPGPSLRKLLKRIDAEPQRTAARSPITARTSTWRAWRAPALAWAASVLVVLAGALWVTGQRWSLPLYGTYTDPPAHSAGVLQIALAPSLSIAEAGKLLQATGARIVEGPDASGVFRVSPAGTAAITGQDMSQQLQDLAARLRADPRVRWIEPLPAAADPGGPSPPRPH